MQRTASLACDAWPYLYVCALVVACLWEKLRQ